MSNSKRKRKSEETNLVRVAVEKNINDVAVNNKSLYGEEVQVWIMISNGYALICHYII